MLPAGALDTGFLSEKKKKKKELTLISRSIHDSLKYPMIFLTSPHVVCVCVCVCVCVRVQGQIGIYLAEKDTLM